MTAHAHAAVATRLERLLEMTCRLIKSVGELRYAVSFTQIPAHIRTAHPKGAELPASPQECLQKCHAQAQELFEANLLGVWIGRMEEQHGQEAATSGYWTADYLNAVHYVRRIKPEAGVHQIEEMHALLDLSERVVRLNQLIAFVKADAAFASDVLEDVPPDDHGSGGQKKPGKRRQRGRTPISPARANFYRCILAECTKGRATAAVLESLRARRDVAEMAGAIGLPLDGKAGEALVKAAKAWDQRGQKKKPRT